MIRIRPRTPGTPEFPWPPRPSGPQETLWPHGPPNIPDLMDIKDVTDLKNLTNMDPMGLTDPTDPAEYLTLFFVFFICPQHTVIIEECGGQQPPPRPRRKPVSWWQEIQCCLDLSNLPDLKDQILKAFDFTFFLFNRSSAHCDNRRVWRLFGGQQPPWRPGRGRCPDWWQEIQCCQGAIKTEMDSKVYPFFVLHGGRLPHWEESFHIPLPQPLTTSGEATFAIKVIKPKSQYSTYLS